MDADADVIPATTDFSEVHPVDAIFFGLFFWWAAAETEIPDLAVETTTVCWFFSCFAAAEAEMETEAAADPYRSYGTLEFKKWNPRGGRKMSSPFHDII